MRHAVSQNPVIFPREGQFLCLDSGCANFGSSTNRVREFARNQILLLLGFLVILVIHREAV